MIQYSITGKIIYQDYSDETAAMSSSSSIKSPGSSNSNSPSDEYQVFTIVPSVPTPNGLSRYEYGRIPSGLVIQSSGKQEIEFFTRVANVPVQA